MNKQNKRKIRASSGMIENTSFASRVFDCIMIVMLALIAFASIIPLWHCLMSSISDGRTLLAHDGLVVLPVGEVTLDGYKLLLDTHGQPFWKSSVFSGYMNTIIYVVGNAGFGFIINVLAGYVLSRQTLHRDKMLAFVVFTMLFSGGVVPLYMVNRSLGLVGTRWAMVLLHCTNAAFVVMVTRGFSSVPEETVEAAKMDGAGHFRIMFQVMLPQCFSFVLITMVNSAIIAYNAWYSASIYVPTDKTRWPIQLWIRELIAMNADFMNYTNPDYNRYLIQFSVIIFATVPLILCFPFFIRKLEKGMAAGAVKG